MVQQHKTSFKNYAAASAFVKKLGLRSMQDWIDYSKGKDANGNLRPKDIPSNPWTVYRSELEAKGAKFSINKFIGSSRKTKSKLTPQASTVVPKATKVIRIVTKPREKPLTYFKAKSLLKKMHVKSRADFNALVRMRMLPVNFPKNPLTTFKAQWKGWKSFCGTP